MNSLPEDEFTARRAARTVSEFCHIVTFKSFYILQFIMFQCFGFENAAHCNTVVKTRASDIHSKLYEASAA
jgi:hypothetical protein